MNINETMRELAQYTRLQEEAAEVVESWDSSYKANGTYLFDNPKF